MGYKLVAFDLDGTLIDGVEFSWKLLHDRLKTDLQKRTNAKDAFFSKKITYHQWAKHDVMLWKEMNLTRSMMLQAISDIKMMPGAVETLNVLRKKKILVGVISGSLDIFLEKVFPGFRFDFLYINKLIFKQDIIDDVIPTEHDFSGKQKALMKEAKKRDIEIKDTVFVGDHDNDISIAKAAGLSIAFNSKSKELDRVSDIRLSEKDMKGILKHII